LELAKNHVPQKSALETYSRIAHKFCHVMEGARSAALAIVAAVAISMLLYVLVHVALLLRVPVNAFVTNANPLSFALTAAHALAYLSIIVAVDGLIATA
jgi:amino acid transporter